MKLRRRSMIASRVSSLSARRAWIEICSIPVKRRLTATSLSARRAWIEIPWTSATMRRSTGRSPQGERGLKYPHYPRRLYRRRRSPQGERGLKLPTDVPRERRISRSPQGERGLKSTWADHQRIQQKSLSARRAWIEIVAKGWGAVYSESLSARRAWIEISAGYGEAKVFLVALRKESVD